MRFGWPAKTMTAALGFIMLSGCVRHAPVYQSTGPQRSGSNGTNSQQIPRKWIVTPEEGVEGKVTWVNANLRFVVVTFPIGRTPEPDRRLNIYRKGLKVGEITITGLQREDSVVGDLIAGEAESGDTVR
jgi:hypothetical protein